MKTETTERFFLTSINFIDFPAISTCKDSLFFELS